MTEKDDKWKNNLEKLVQFIKVHKRLPTKYNRNDAEKPLAHWRHHNISQYNRGLLSEERVKLIELSGILVDTGEQAWLEMLERTRKFIDMYGRYPSRFDKTAEGKKCGRWRGEQATIYRKNEMPPYRRRLFEEAELTGNISTLNWNRWLKRVVQFRKKYGRMPNNNGSEPDETMLVMWCYRNNRALELNRLTDPRRVSLLKAAGIPECRKNADPWENQYKLLTTFIRKHSHLPLHGSNGAERKLYQWYFDQLTKINKGKLIGDKKMRIEKIKRTMLPPGKVARMLKSKKKGMSRKDL